jgi:hypothetical protein
MRNVQYARASFGLHLLLNMLLMIFLYVITYVIMRLRHGKMDAKYERLWLQEGEGVLEEEGEDDVINEKAKLKIKVEINQENDSFDEM